MENIRQQILDDTHILNHISLSNHYHKKFLILCEGLAVVGLDEGYLVDGFCEGFAVVGLDDGFLVDGF